MITIDKSSPEPLHLQLSKKLKNIIVKHRLEAGYALPSERQLSEKFELNRNTVHRAYETLKDNGLLVSRAGSRGIFISEDAKDFFIKMGFTIFFQGKRSYFKPYLGKVINFYVFGKKF